MRDALMDKLREHFRDYASAGFKLLGARDVARAIMRRPENRVWRIGVEHSDVFTVQDAFALDKFVSFKLSDVVAWSFDRCIFTVTLRNVSIL